LSYLLLPVSETCKMLQAALCHPSLLLK